MKHVIPRFSAWLRLFGRIQRTQFSCCSYMKQCRRRTFRCTCAVSSWLFRKNCCYCHPPWKFLVEPLLEPTYDWFVLLLTTYTLIENKWKYRMNEINENHASAIWKCILDMSRCTWMDRFQTFENPAATTINVQCWLCSINDENDVISVFWNPGYAQKRCARSVFPWWSVMPPSQVSIRNTEDRRRSSSFTVLKCLFSCYSVIRNNMLLHGSLLLWWVNATAMKSRHELPFLIVYVTCLLHDSHAPT